MAQENSITYSDGIFQVLCFSDHSFSRELMSVYSIYEKMVTHLSQTFKHPCKFFGRWNYHVD